MTRLSNQGNIDSLLKNPTIELKDWEKDWISKQIVCAVSECVQRGIVHRDIKAENFLVHQAKKKSYIVRLIDFGMAYFLKSDNKNESTRFCGTPRYLPPEIWDEYKKNKRSTPATFSRDAWAVGCVLYYIGTKKLYASPAKETNRLNLSWPPRYGIDVGIFTQEIKDLLFLDPKSRSNMSSIENRIRYLYAKTYPEKSDFDSKISSKNSIFTPINFTETPIEIETLCETPLEFPKDISSDDSPLFGQVNLELSDSRS